MKNIYTFLFLILCFVNSLSAQKQEVYYYNSERLKADKSDASYYKVLNYTKDGKIDGKIKDYYKSGEGLSMVDGAKEINKDDDNKSVYWGKKIEYYKNQLMKSKSLCDLEGKLIYQKEWYENGKIKSFISLIPGYNSLIIMNYNEDGSVSTSKITDEKGELDPRTFNQRDGIYYTSFSEDFTTEKNQNIWDEEWPLKEGQFKVGEGYQINTFDNNHYKKIIPIFDSYHNPYSISVDLHLETGDKNTMHGLIYNYVDSDKYSCFGVNSSGEFVVYHVDNSDIKYEVQKRKDENINDNRKTNKLSITKFDGFIEFSINDNSIYKSKKVHKEAIAFGLFSDGGKKNVTITNVSLSYMTDYMQNIQETTIGSDGAIGNGTAFMIDERGYLVTNNHVVKDAKYVEVEFTWAGKMKTFPAKVVAQDVENDFAILRIISNNFKTNGAIPYSILQDNIAVGSEVFTLGFPQALISMGKEVKFTDGKISSLSGYKNDKIVYQTTIPVQGGNSGGAVFDNNGNIIGVLSSGMPGNENVSYAIKSSFLIQFIRQFNSDLVIKRSGNLSKLPLTDKIKNLSNHVALVKIW